jgi:hypothetical protein
MMDRARHPSPLTAFAFASAALAGCQLLAAPERLKIPDASNTGGGGGTDAAATTSSVGGSTSTASTSVGVGGSGGGSASPLGASCSTGTQCDSGFCVDGVCCNTPCDAGCAACTAALGAAMDGTCTTAAIKNADDIGSCDATHGACGNNEKCACTNDGACAQEGVVQLVAGSQHVCARSYFGAVKCWGNNTYGQLGLGDVQHRGDAPNEMGLNLPTLMLGQPATSLTAGDNHTCALLADSSVKCWGANQSGQLGIVAPQQLAPAAANVNLGTGKTATSITAGGDHTCAHLNDGTVKCWGANGNGELGLGDTMNRGTAVAQMGDALPPVALGTGAVVAHVAAGRTHSCAVMMDNTVKCWGDNTWGQLGMGVPTSPIGSDPMHLGDNLPTVNIGNGLKAAGIFAGDAFTCALLTDAKITCWGKNDQGQLGTENMVPVGTTLASMSSLATMNLGAGVTVSKLALGTGHACAVLADGGLKCWGRNAFGQLGLGSFLAAGSTPNSMGDLLFKVDLGSGLKARHVALGANFSCALLVDGQVKCWGFGAYGELGDGQNTKTVGGAMGEMGDALPPLSIGPFSN